MSYEEIVKKVSEELQLPERLVERTYKAYWRSIKEHITSLPLKDNLTEEEFGKLQPNVNIPSIGKLNVTYDKYKRTKKMFEIKSQLKEK